MRDERNYLGQAFMEDSQLHVISMEFKKKPYCTFLLGKKKRTTDVKKVCEWKAGRQQLGI